MPSPTRRHHALGELRRWAQIGKIRTMLDGFASGAIRQAAPCGPSPTLATRSGHHQINRCAWSNRGRFPHFPSRTSSVSPLRCQAARRIAALRMRLSRVTKAAKRSRASSAMSTSSLAPPRLSSRISWISGAAGARSSRKIGAIRRPHASSMQKPMRPVVAIPSRISRHRALAHAVCHANPLRLEYPWYRRPRPARRRQSPQLIDASSRCAVPQT